MENLIKTICVGWLEKGTGKHQSNAVFDKDGLSPCIMAGFAIKQPATMIVVEDTDECQRKK